jgi:hypothetical protein
MGKTCSTYGERRGAYRVLVGKHSEDADINGRVILKWIVEKWG